MRRVHDVLAASLICVSGQIAWVDRRASGMNASRRVWPRVQKQDGEIYSHLMRGWKSLNPTFISVEEGIKAQEARASFSTS